MNFAQDSAVFEGAMLKMGQLGVEFPYEYTCPRDESLPCRHTAWLGIQLNNSPIFCLSGSDAAAMLEKTCTNAGFDKMAVGQSKHAVIVNGKGHMLADGVIMKLEDEFRTYWLAPVLQFYAMRAQAEGMDVQFRYVQDEYFIQIDGPESLAIVEEATRTDLHDLKFAQNRTVDCLGTPMVVHRLGMSGSLAYEVHGDAENFEAIYKHLRAITLAHGGVLQGTSNYAIVNHTPAGYPNQLLHFQYALFEDDPELAAFAEKAYVVMPCKGSAADTPEAYYVNPYEVGWGNLCAFKSKGDYQGREALEALRDARNRKVVTLEWNADDCADVYLSQISGPDVEPYDDQLLYSTSIHDNGNGAFSIRGDLVLDGDKTIGIAVGRTFEYEQRRMISLAYIDPDYAEEGRELVVLWGDKKFARQKKIRATVAQYPYYQGEWRNETFDTERIPHPSF